MLMMTSAGCASAPKPIAVCDGTQTARSDHAAALVADGAPMARSTGRTLIALVDEGCLNASSPVAVCDGTRKARSDHALALVEDGGNGAKSRATGRTLIALIDAGCRGRR